MSSVKSVNNLNDNLARFLPTPRNSGGASFSSFIKNVAGAVGGATSAITGIDPGYQELLNKQIEIQRQMQLVSLHSNIEKSRHETQMAAIRNIRAS